MPRACHHYNWIRVLPSALRQLAQIPAGWRPCQAGRRILVNGKVGVSGVRHELHKWKRRGSSNLKPLLDRRIPEFKAAVPESYNFAL